MKYLYLICLFISSLNSFGQDTENSSKQFRSSKQLFSINRLIPQPEKVELLIKHGEQYTLYISEQKNQKISVKSARDLDRKITDLYVQLDLNRKKLEACEVQFNFTLRGEKMPICSADKESVTLINRWMRKLNF